MRRLLYHWKRIVLLTAFGVIALIFVITIPAVQDVVTQPLIMNEPLEKADLILVLGGGVERDGSISPIVADRIAEGVHLASEGWGNTLVFSGGPAHNNERFVESVQMAAYLRDHWTIAANVITEERSISTRTNAEYTRLLMAEQGWNTAIVVTSAFHTRRACNVFRKLTIDVICRAAQPSYTFRSLWDQLRLTKGIIREYGATLYYKLAGYI